MTKSPFNSVACNLISLGMTVLVATLAWLLKATPFKYIHDIINNRGVVVYLCMFFLLRNIAAYYAAKRMKTFPPYFLRQFFVYSWFPLILGVVTSLSLLGSAFTAQLAFLTITIDNVSHIMELMKDSTQSLAVAFDITVLHLVAYLLSLIYYCNALALPNSSESKEVEQAN